MILVGFTAALGLVVRDHGPLEAKAEVRPHVFSTGEMDRLREELDAARGELELAHAQLERWNTVFGFATRFEVAPELAGKIYDVALAEGIEPELAFRLVRLESDFNTRATSKVGAIGLTQVMLPTARYFDKDITRERLYHPETNLRIGFRYLRTLIREHKGNVRLALLLYNRGPVAVMAAKETVEDPSNGYDLILMKGYKGRGVVD